MDPEDENADEGQGRPRSDGSHVELGREARVPLSDQGESRDGDGREEERGEEQGSDRAGGEHERQRIEEQGEGRGKPPED